MGTAGQDVVDILTADHRGALQLIHDIRTEPEAEQQRQIADVLIAEVVRHAVAEEAIVYPAMRDHLPDGDQAVEHDIREHHDIEITLQELEGATSGAGSFTTCVERLQAQLTHHAEDEESEQFPLLRANIDADTLTSMGDRVELIKRVAPTRPHPDAPDSPAFHLTVGPGVGLVDRLKDYLSGRITSPDDLPGPGESPDQG